MGGNTTIPFPSSSWKEHTCSLLPLIWTHNSAFNSIISLLDENLYPIVYTGDDYISKFRNKEQEENMIDMGLQDNG